MPYLYKKYDVIEFDISKCIYTKDMFITSSMLALKGRVLGTAIFD